MTFAVRLQQANARRNAAVTKNLSAVKNQGTKLSKLVGSLDADVTPNIWQKLANSHGTFKLCVDIFGLLACLAYIASAAAQMDILVLAIMQL